MGMWKRFFENLGFWWGSGSTLFLSDSTKTPEMNELDTELSKKSKIIEIGSVEKKLQLFKVGEISENFGNPGFSYSKIQICLPKLSQILKISKNLEKVFLIMLFQFWNFVHDFWYSLFTLKSDTHLSRTEAFFTQKILFLWLKSDDLPT